MTIDPDLVDIALDRVKGSTFESFSNAFFPVLLGADFSPLGGMHDGGADGYGGDTVFERVGRTGNFFQASVQVDVRAKLRATTRRLKEYGREPRMLTYFTSRVVSAIDVLEDTLSEELGVSIRVKDAAYIRAHVNDNDVTQYAFEKFLRPEVSFLEQLGSSTIIPASKNVTSPAVFVFLRQEVDKLDGDLSLVNSVTDSLCLWALEGTDPDAGILMSAEEVKAKILDQVPSAESIIREKVGKRLQAMSMKEYPGGRQVKWHRREKKFVLPHETRLRIVAENQRDEALRVRVLRSLADRAISLGGEITEEQADRVAAMALRALQQTFESEGLEFSHFVTSEEELEYPQIGDAVREVAHQMAQGAEDPTILTNQVLMVIRQCLYHSHPDERDYLGRLARTYSLLFTLSNEPRLVRYFEQMGSDFYLYVGTDMLVRALSERYLPPESQLCRNVLAIAAQGGAKLVLTEPVVDEVYMNLRLSDLEFRHHFEAVEHRLTADMIREAPMILVRAYLYNRSQPFGPANWPAFVNQFCNHADLFKPEGQFQVQHYLQATFSMEYRSRADLGDLVDADIVDALTQELMSEKQNANLASNDALLACSVYGHRQRRSETSQLNEFGFKTWWLTNETRILRHTRDLERANRGARYMMRPDFLLNFFTFAPKVSDVRKSFSTIFPSSLGIQLSRRMDDGAFHRIMAEVKEAEGYEEGRRLAIMAECADKLKADFDRRYRFELREHR
ncbi:hypothetical protein [Intrasporangium chromatireducens]|uniref:hypothetical protein n=1 Tax=Intrasporangium chromatireducens TaxID=1386088 RepID=UPI0012DED2BA|nr:hypothetical protein [Intrasporangium chromatireducens]